MSPDLTVLLARARVRDPEAVDALADLVEIAAANPERRVRAALGLGHRGGVSARGAALIAERDDALRELASIVAPGLPIEQQAREIGARLGRYQPSASRHDEGVYCGAAPLPKPKVALFA